MLDNVILMDSYRPRPERTDNAHQEMLTNADVRMLRQLVSWAEFLAEVAEHFEEPLHPDDRKKVLNMLAVKDDHPIQL